MIWLDKDTTFPPYEFTTLEGIIALGGDLSPNRLIHAYKHGIFPWYMDGEPIVWYCPYHRMVLFPEDIKISKSMRKVLRTHQYRITENTAFDQVIYACKHIKRGDDFGTWITDEMEDAYLKLHELGFAKSIEVWQDQELVGGLYGVEVNGIFCGESMFSKVSNTSKLAFIHLVESKRYRFIDCQVYNDHLASLGAREIPRREFLNLLKKES